MRPSVLFLCALAATGTQASWFGSDAPEYTSWDAAQNRAWLEAHNVKVPKGVSETELQDLVKSNWNAASAWTAEQYAKAQKAFVDVKDSTFDSWDESRLREFLLEQGVVTPSGPRESLALMAKQKYRAYTQAASSFSSAASTAVYGDATQQASKSATSLASQASATVSSAVSAATTEVARKFDESKDYIYSSWDESALRAYLQEKGIVEPKATTTREQLLAYMKDSYAKTADPVWTAWSTSYIHEWLVAHGIIKTDAQQKRDELVKSMENYYYGTKDTVYSSWDDSQLKEWLVQHDIIKSDAQVQREKLQKLISENYAYASDTIWASWRDSDMRDWLIEHGYLRTDAQKTRDDLVKLMSQKYNEASTKTTSYLVWPDARLRAYLRNNGLPESALPTSRPSLLQEVRIRWVQTNSKAEALFAQIKATLESGVEVAEEKLGQMLAILTGTANEASASASASASSASAKASASLSSIAAEGSRSAAAAKAKAKAEL